MKVRRPAAWRLVARSQPMMALHRMARAMRSSADQTLISADQLPSSAAMGS